MGSFGSSTGRVLYLIVCAAPAARQADRLVRSRRDAGWDVCVVLTPSATAWVDREALASASGHAVRSEFRGPDDEAFDPLGDAVLVAPASFNTLNKVAAGINDNLAVGLVNEGLGAGVPLAVVPWVGPQLAAHPAYDRSLAVLRSAGAAVLAPAGEDDEAFLRAAARFGPP